MEQIVPSEQMQHEPAVSGLQRIVSEARAARLRSQEEYIECRRQHMVERIMATDMPIQEKAVHLGFVIGPYLN